MSFQLSKRLHVPLKKLYLAKGLHEYQKINCYLIFDIKMDFTRKARFVAGDHMTDLPELITYSSIVSRVIAFLIAALNDLDVCAADIGNAYLNADYKDKIWVKAGKEFGADEGKLMIIAKALLWFENIWHCVEEPTFSSIKEMGFTSSKADPDLHYHALVKKNGEQYYEYLLVEVKRLAILVGW